jgi:hypothetical protein
MRTPETGDLAPSRASGISVAPQTWPARLRATPRSKQISGCDGVQARRTTAAVSTSSEVFRRSHWNAHVRISNLYAVGLGIPAALETVASFEQSLNGSRS